MSALSWLALSLALTSGGYDLGPAHQLRVLYAGAPGEEREAAFVELLEGAFDEVRTLPLTRLVPELARDYDLVVADWRPSYSDGSWTSSGRLAHRLEPGFPTPMLFVGDLAGALPRGTKFRHL